MIGGILRIQERLAKNKNIKNNIYEDENEVYEIKEIPKCINCVNWCFSKQKLAIYTYDRFDINKKIIPGNYYLVNYCDKCNFSIDKIDPLSDGYCKLDELDNLFPGWIINK